MQCFAGHSRYASRWRSSGTLSGTCRCGVLLTAGAQGQHRLGQHGQGHVPVPALPVADFVVANPSKDELGDAEKPVGHYPA
jgi:hypothetical protein